MAETSADEFEMEIAALAAEFPGDQTEALQACDALILAGIEENFAASSSARREPWPLRKDPKPKHPLLILEGNLKQAATTGTAQNDGTELVRRMPSGPSGTSLAGIRRHEFGDREVLGREGILARPYYGVSAETADRCTEVVADAVLEFVTGRL